MKVLVISGGRHPYEESTPILESFLKGAGHDVTVTEDASPLADRSANERLRCAGFSTPAGRTSQISATGRFQGPKWRACGITSAAAAGSSASTSPPVWRPRGPSITTLPAGGWISGTSYHPPYGEFTVNISQAGHPGADGIADFSTNDELYMNLAIKDGNDVFLTGTAEDGVGIPGCGGYSARWA